MNSFIYIVLSVLAITLFLLDIMLGSITIPMPDIIDILLGKGSHVSWEYIILNFRLPKAITAVFVGAGISSCGLLMQTLFRNPLADTSILGISSGASLGVASFVMLSALFPAFIPASVSSNYWGMVLSAIIGASIILCLVSSIISWLKDIVSVLIIGVMFGFVTSSIVAIMQYFSDPEIIKNYIVWSFGSLNGTTWNQLQYVIPVVSVGLLVSLCLPKYLNSLLLGDNYARSVGIQISKVRFTIVFITSIITGTLVAFTGPISFIGIAVPHYTRILFRTTNHRVLFPGAMLCGICLMLFCDIITQLPGNGIILPINAVTSIMGAPVVVFIIIKRRKLRKTIFN